MKPPWSVTDEEWHTTVRRGNRYTSGGLEEVQEWWIGVFILVTPFALLLFCFLTSRRY